MALSVAELRGQDLSELENGELARRRMCNGLRRRNAYGVVEPGTDRALLLYSSSNLIAGGSFGFDARGAHPATLAPPALDAPANIASCLFLPQPDVQVPWMGLGMLLGPVGAQGDSVWVSSLAVYAGRLFAGGNFSWSLALDPDDETGPRRVDGWASMSILCCWPPRAACAR